MSQTLEEFQVLPKFSFLTDHESLHIFYLVDLQLVRGASV